MSNTRKTPPPGQSRLKVRSHASEAGQVGSSDNTEAIRQHEQSTTHNSRDSSPNRKHSEFKKPFVNPSKNTRGIFSLAKGLLTIAMMAVALYWTTSPPTTLLNGEDSTVAIKTDASGVIAQPTSESTAAATPITAAPQELISSSITNEHNSSNSNEIRLDKVPELPTKEQAVTKRWAAERKLQNSQATAEIGTTATAQIIEQETPTSALLTVQTYKATMFSHPTNTDATETPIQHGTLVEPLETQGEWVKIQVKSTGDIGYIHRTQVN